MKADCSRLIPLKLTVNLELLLVKLEKQFSFNNVAMKNGQWA